MERGGSADHLVQTFTEHNTHSYLSDPVFPALLDALLTWVDRGEKPTATSIAMDCAALEAEYGASCRFLPDFRPQPLAARVPPR
jgi:hypothetical protein